MVKTKSQNASLALQTAGDQQFMRARMHGYTRSSKCLLLHRSESAYKCMDLQGWSKQWKAEKDTYYHYYSETHSLCVVQKHAGNRSWVWR